MPTIHSSSRRFLLQLGVSRLPKSVDQTLLLHRDENFFQLPAPTIDNSLDNNIVEDRPGCVFYVFVVLISNVFAANGTCWSSSIYVQTLIILCAHLMHQIYRLDKAVIANKKDRPG